MSIARHKVRPRPGAILIGPVVALALMASALLPGGAGAGSTPGAHHLVFRLSGARHQDVVDSGAVKVRVRCPAEACTVVASATAKSPSVRSATVRAHVPAGGAQELAIAVTARQGAKLAAARKAGKVPTLTVHATAKDGAGNTVPLTFAVLVTRS
jgi:hypothetical protein